MGRRGPPPVPTRLKLLAGETRPSRINAATPEPLPDLPAMPDDLSNAAQTVWQRVLARYGATGVITAVDGDALRAYSEATARYVYAARKLEESGPLVRGAHRAELVRNPLHQIVRDNADQMRAWARELGLTPAARTGLQGQPVAAGSPMARYLARGRRPPA